MSELTIERLGGFGGFGLPGSHIRSRGTLETAALSPDVRAKVDELFDAGSGGAPTPDGFRYRITRVTPGGSQTIEVPESVVPEELQDSVTDELL
jgi:hypothetical protein